MLLRYDVLEAGDWIKRARLIKSPRLENLLGELDEAGDNLLLLVHDVHDDVQLVDDVADLTLEFRLVFDAGLVGSP